MSTTAQFVNHAPKKLLGFQDFGTRFLDYLRENIRETHESVYQTDVVFDSALTLDSLGPDVFDITGVSLATDGDGHMLDIDNSGFDRDIQFENTLTVLYYVALRHNLKPDGVQINPRTGLPEYLKNEEIIGERAEPDVVVDNGNGTITFTVDSVTEVGISNEGRKVLVFRKLPAKDATSEAIAIEELTAAFTGGLNKITTVDDLGQGASISTTASDYEVILLGPTVKRNTDLRSVDNVVFVGIVTGAGAGNSPTSFDISDQEIFAGSISQLGQITRVDSHGFLKIDVKADASDSGEHQIRVTDAASVTKFSIDEVGNVVIHGDLEIKGETTQQDLVQVNSSETITDNLTAGDNDAVDSHLIKGIWKHTDTAGTANHFYVDGATGRIGFNVAPDGTWQFKSSSDWRFTDARLRVEGAGGTRPAVEYLDTGYDVEGGGLWRVRAYDGIWHLDQNTAAAGDFSTTIEWLLANVDDETLYVGQNLSPVADDTWDLGNATCQWRDLWIDRIANIDELLLSTAAGEGLGSDMLPDTTDTRDLGSASRRFAEGHFRTIQLSEAAGYGVNSGIIPTTTDTFDIGSATKRWNTLHVVNISFVGDFLPAVDDTQDLGSASLEWKDLWIDGIATIDTLVLSTAAGEGVGSDLHPVTDGTFDLGSSSWEWKDLWLSGIAYIAELKVSDEVNSHLIPALDNTHSLGTTDLEWKDLWIDGTATIDKLMLSTAALEGVVGHFYPDIDNTKDLGVAGRAWRSLEVTTVNTTGVNAQRVNEQYCDVGRMVKTSQQVFTATWVIVDSYATSDANAITVYKAGGYVSVPIAGWYRFTCILPLGEHGTSDTVCQGRFARYNSSDVFQEVVSGSHGRCSGSTTGKDAVVCNTIVWVSSTSDRYYIEMQQRTDADGVPVAFASIVDDATNSIAHAVFTVERLGLDHTGA